MTVFFSQVTGGFYDDVIKNAYVAAGTWPEDAAPVSDRWYQRLIEGQSEGKIITVNEYGQPVLSDPPPPTPEQLQKAAEAEKNTLMQVANDAISPLQDAAELDMATQEELTQLTAWKQYRVKLNRIDTGKAPDITWPEVPADVA